MKLVSSTFSSVLKTLARGQNLTRDRARKVLSGLLTDSVSPAYLGAFLMAYKLKPLNILEFAGFREAILERATPFPRFENSIDLVGTGGDGFDAFNASSLASIIISSCQKTVIKHGSRSVTSKSGSSDFLTELGVNITTSPEQTARGVAELGIGYLFAPVYHPSFVRVATVRKELPFPTLFNLLGPVANPAEPAVSVIGVAELEVFDLYKPLLTELSRSGRTFILVRGQEGLDEMSPAGPSRVCEIARGQSLESEITPEDIGLEPINLSEVCRATPAQNAARALELLKNFRGHPLGPLEKFVFANAALGMAASDLHTGGSKPTSDLVRRIRSALPVVEEAVFSGAALVRLRQWRRFSSSDPSGFQ